MIHEIESDTPFDVECIYFWETGDITYLYGSRKILTCLYFMAGFGIGSATEMKKITPDQEERWYFGSLLVPFGLQKMIVVDTDGLFTGTFKKTFQETLLISVHAVERGNHKAIRNEGFHRYLNKVQKIN